MKIKYLGHAALTITADSGLKIMTDPYATSPDLTYGKITEAADIVTVSHDHADHANVVAVGGNPRVVKGVGSFTVGGIEFRGIASYHDDEGGRMRGGNTIFCFEVDGIRLCHLGDLGHRLSDQQKAEIGRVGVLIIPVGGYYTIDAWVATEVCNQLKPGVTIPIHYRTEKGLPNLAGVDDFLRGKSGVKWLDTSSVELKAGRFPAGQIIVLKPAL